MAERYRTAEKFLETNPSRSFEIADELPEFPHGDDLRLELLSRASLRTGRPVKARRTLQKLRDAAQTDAKRFWAGLVLAELHLLGSDREKADAMTERLDDADLEGLRSAERRYFLARLWRIKHDLAVANDDTDRARECALTLVTEYPASDPTERPGLVRVGRLEPSERYVRAKHLYSAWSYHRARWAFDALRRHPTYGDNARWYLAQIALNKLRDRPEEAERLFASLEDSPYARDALYNQARAQMSQEDYEAALETLDEYAQRYPGGRHIDSVYYYRGWLPYDHRNNDAAIEGFEDFIDRYGKGHPDSSYVYGFLSWTHMRKREWRKAIRWYDEMESFGNMLVWGKALYWQAYAHRELGERERALAKLDELRELYPVTYYGVLGEQLRAKIEDRDPRASEVWWPDDGGTTDDAPRIDVADYDASTLSSEEQTAWNRVETLVQLGERERARQTLDPIYDDLIADVEPARKEAWIHAVGTFVGDYHRMWIEATGGSISAMPDPPDPKSLEAPMAYPRAYRDVVDDVAAEFDIPPYLMWSIMRQESRYHPAQISHANAVGALQMIPKTARKVAEDLGTTYNPRTFYKPEVGFRFSGFYMKKLLDTFDGHFVPMAASYNSGPKVVAHWFEENPDASFPWLIEEFAYNEGRNYCRKVAEHMVRYLYLYEEDEKRRDRILNKLFPVDRDAIAVPDEVGY